MYLRRNFSFNQKNITQKPKKNKKKKIIIAITL